MPVDAYPFAPAAYQHKAIEGEEKERMKEKKKKGFWPRAPAVLPPSRCTPGCSLLAHWLGTALDWSRRRSFYPGLGWLHAELHLVVPPPKQAWFMAGLGSLGWMGWLLPPLHIHDSTRPGAAGPTGRATGRLGACWQPPEVGFRLLAAGCWPKYLPPVVNTAWTWP